MKIKIHSGFRAAQAALAAAPAAALRDPALPKASLPKLAAKPPAAKKKGLPFGGKQAPLFQKKKAFTV